MPCRNLYSMHLNGLSTMSNRKKASLPQMISMSNTFNNNYTVSRSLYFMDIVYDYSFPSRCGAIELFGTYIVWSLVNWKVISPRGHLALQLMHIGADFQYALMRIVWVSGHSYWLNFTMLRFGMYHNGSIYRLCGRFHHYIISHVEQSFSQSYFIFPSLFFLFAGKIMEITWTKIWRMWLKW